MHAWIVICPEDNRYDPEREPAPGIQTLVAFADMSGLNETVNNILSYWGAHMDRPLDNDPDVNQFRAILNDGDTLEGPDSGLELCVFPAHPQGPNLIQGE